MELLDKVLNISGLLLIFGSKVLYNCTICTFYKFHVCTLCFGVRVPYSVTFCLRRYCWYGPVLE